MSELHKQLDGVTPEAEATPVTENELELETTPEEPEAEPKGEEDKEAEGDRPVQNLQREFDRKMSKQSEELNARIDAMSQQLISTIQNTQQPSKKNATLDDMSVPELKTQRAQIAEDNPLKGDLDKYIVERENKEYIDTRVSQITSAQATKVEQTRWNQTAVNRYPALKDTKSDFYREVNTRLNEFGNDYVAKNPRAILDAANDVAIESGFAKTALTRNAPSKPALSKSKPAPDSEAQPSMPKAERDRIAKRLKSALPSGKEFTDKDIATSSDLYKGTLDKRGRR